MRIRWTEPAIQVRRYAKYEPLVDDDALRIAAVGDAAKMLVWEIVGKRPVGTELFKSSLTLRTGSVGVYHAADRGEIAGLKFLNLSADLGDAAYNLVAGNTGIDRRHCFIPLVADLMQVGVANSAEENFDLNVVLGRVTTGDCGSCKR